MCHLHSRMERRCRIRTADALAQRRAGAPAQLRQPVAKILAFGSIGLRLPVATRGYPRLPAAVAVFEAHDVVLAQVGAVLAGDAGDDSGFGFGHDGARLTLSLRMETTRGCKVRRCINREVVRAS